MNWQEEIKNKSLFKYAHPILLALDDSNGQTMLELKKTTRLGQRAILSGIGELERLGCIGWEHERIGDYDVWHKRYFLVGEGTADYIKAVRELVDSDKHRYLPYDYKNKRKHEGTSRMTTQEEIDVMKSMLLKEPNPYEWAEKMPKGYWSYEPTKVFIEMTMAYEKERGNGLIAGVEETNEWLKEQIRRAEWDLEHGEHKQ